MKPKWGDVWLADLGLAAKLRPVIIVSRDDPDPPRALVLYVPLTTLFWLWYVVVVFIIIGIIVSLMALVASKYESENQSN